MPEDPFPDLTLVELQGTTIRNGHGQIVQLIPGRVILAEVTERDDDGTITRVRPVP